MRLAAAPPDPELGKKLQQYYARLHENLGPQGWWPAHTRLEVILGAILTQNTTWRNAALALRRLRKAGLLKLAKIQQASRADLEACVRPAGSFRQKARTIRNFLAWLAAAYDGALAALFARPAAESRRELLELEGLGPETVDVILLYAGRKPYFIADAYTRRILGRHGLIPLTAKYGEVQQLLHRNLLPDPAMFNEYHALLVEVGKRYCQRQAPRCEGCPLEPFLPRHPIVGSGPFGRPDG